MDAAFVGFCTTSKTSYWVDPLDWCWVVGVQEGEHTWASSGHCRRLGVVVDVVGGTSIGSFVGALVAGFSDYWSMVRHFRDFSTRSCSYLHILGDVTYPYTSLLTGHSLNRSVWKVFGDTCIRGPLASLLLSNH